MKFGVVNIIILIMISSCSSMDKNKTSEDQSNELESISFDVKKKVFKNGLTAIVVENPKLPIFSYYTYFKVGGKYEDDGITGASHFLEHMMFKGAKKYPEGEFDKIVEGNGGSNNAYTSNDLTVYYENLPSEHVNKIIDLEADRMQNMALNPKSFEKERKVVLEERKMRYENSDRGKLYLKMMKAVFEGTPYGTSVIGKIKDLKSVTRDQIFEYFKKFYAPNNAIVLIVGDVNSDDIFDELEEKFGKIPKNESLEIDKAQILVNKGFDFKGKYDGRTIKLHGTSPEPSFFLAFKGIKIGPREAYILDILSSILGDGGSSYLTGEYVLNKKPVLTRISASNYTLQDSGVFFVGGQLMKGANLKWIQKDLYKKIKNGCKNAITEKNVQKIKNQYLVQMISGLETNAGIAGFLGNREVYYGDYNFYQKEIGIYNSVNIKELKEACSKYLTKKDSIFISIWNKHKK